LLRQYRDVIENREEGMTICRVSGITNTKQWHFFSVYKIVVFTFNIHKKGYALFFVPKKNNIHKKKIINKLTLTKTPLEIDKQENVLNNMSKILMVFFLTKCQIFMLRNNKLDYCSMENRNLNYRQNTFIVFYQIKVLIL
jgi:hypothetical protein